jgi:CMP-N-acetylneuraminic acid synthetase
MEILGVIPARGGSKGIPRKNLTMLNHKPLLEYTVRAAQQCSMLSKIILSTDNYEIADFGRSHHVEIHKRQEEIARDNTPMKNVIYKLLEDLQIQQNYFPDITVILQPTSPLRTHQHIDEALSKLMIHNKADAIVSVTEVPHQYSPYSIMKESDDGSIDFYIKEGMHLTRRQDKPVFYARNGAAVYAFKTTAFLKTGSFYGDFCLPYFMKAEESIDIDGPLDLEIAGLFLKKRGDA